MDTTNHTLPCLFAQLGLPNDQQFIANFISKNRGLAPEQRLYQANCWNQAQAMFLQEAIEEDSDWAEIVDHLNNLLR